MTTAETISVLLIDDELSICTGVCGVLEMEGYKAEYVMTAQEGLTYLENRPTPDIVLLDVNLGAGLNGVDALCLIKEKNKYLQVIMFTSQDSLDIGLECMKRGALDFLTKPFNFQLFSKIAATAVERKKIEQIRDLYFDMVIHDLKNPLQVIGGAYEMLNDTLKDSGSVIQKRLLEATENGIKQIQMIIGNVIGITNFEKKSLVARHQQFGLKETIESALCFFDSLEISYEQECLDVYSDKDLFVRVITNLVSNASRFAIPGSNVKVHFKKIENSFVGGSVMNLGSYIPPELRGVVFDKFLGVHSVMRAVRGQNFGLGLTFSKMAVEAMDGKIWIDGDESIPSTTFNFIIKNHAVN
jgi:K+-sensing histidine kinase KdpD